MIGLAKVKLDYNGAIELCRYEEDFTFQIFDYYIVETRYGHDLGRILPNSIPLIYKDHLMPEFQILRSAEANDFKLQAEGHKEAEKAFVLTKTKILTHNLPMKLISIHFFLDRNKILFNFTADGRVDFRELVKDLAATFKTRIELRQIGVRDEAMLLGGYGVCGREFCCVKHHTSSEPISIKMAKEQNLTLNSVKISGVCGRLMCCLDYELEHYQQENMSNLNQQITNNHCQGCQKDLFNQNMLGTALDNNPDKNH